MLPMLARANSIDAYKVHINFVWTTCKKMRWPQSRNMPSGWRNQPRRTFEVRISRIIIFKRNIMKTNGTYVNISTEFGSATWVSAKPGREKIVSTLRERWPLTILKTQHEDKRRLRLPFCFSFFVELLLPWLYRTNAHQQNTPWRLPQRLCEVDMHCRAPAYQDQGQHIIVQ